MADEVEMAWVRLAVFGGGVLALVLIARGVSAVIGMAYNELHYHASSGNVGPAGRLLKSVPRGALQRH